MIKAEVKDGIVINIILVDEANIPTWCKDWPVADELCQIGGTYVNGLFAPIPEVLPTEDEIRSTRDFLLSTVVDPVVSNPLRWGDMSQTKQKEWADYRQALLGVPTQVGFPNAVVWPTKPQ